MAVPNIFANVTTSIPLSQLDTNFATAITLGNTAVYLGNTTTTLGNLTLTNVTLSSGTSNLASTSISNGTSNVTVNSSGGNITLGTAGTTAVTIDTSQQVGVNRTPSAGGGPLQVGFDSSGSAAVRIQTTNASTAGEILNFINSSNASSGKVIYGASQTSVVYQTTTAGQSTGATLILNGVAFPATQVASSNANTLDDYEEGTWTPTDGSGASLSFTNVYANYTKIGRFAFFEFQVTYPSTVSGADTRINGFPFNNIDDYEGKPGVCLVAGQGSGFITQKQGSNYGYIVNASNQNITNSQASTRTARAAQYYETT